MFGFKILNETYLFHEKYNLTSKRNYLQIIYLTFTNIERGLIVLKYI